MRFLLKVTPSTELFNQYVKDGSAPNRMQAILAETKPEFAFFTEMNGHRTAILIHDLAEASQIPALGEPWFLQFNAQMEFHPVMLGEDLAKANLDALGKKWG